MIALLIFLLTLLVLPSKPNFRLEAANAALRRQVTILQRKVRGHVRVTNSDRLFFGPLYRLFPSILKTMTIVRPETLLAPGRLSALLVLTPTVGLPARASAQRCGLDFHFPPIQQPSVRCWASGDREFCARSRRLRSVDFRCRSRKFRPRGLGNARWNLLILRRDVWPASSVPCSYPRPSQIAAPA
jgi:hypothetical protein